mmetsp:Transcript_118391/g.342295  ORF Transcript_118391/g.342295 Transcript_118391/m.342295 type:complete len:201 (+) Transcript_118391:1277-1879(+)
MNNGKRSQRICLAFCVARPLADAQAFLRSVYRFLPRTLSDVQLRGRLQRLRFTRSIARRSQELLRSAHRTDGFAMSCGLDSAQGVTPPALGETLKIRKRQHREGLAGRVAEVLEQRDRILRGLGSIAGASALAMLPGASKQGRRFFVLPARHLEQRSPLQSAPQSLPVIAQRLVHGAHQLEHLRTTAHVAASLQQGLRFQ